MLCTEKITLPNGQEVLSAAIIMLKGALKLETLGMKRRGQSAYAQTKELFLFKGDKQSVLTQLNTWIAENIKKV